MDAIGVRPHARDIRLINYQNTAVISGGVGPERCGGWRRFGQ
jgi:hypothetical protein